MRRRENKLNDMPMQGTVDRCKAATLVQFFEREDERIKSVSELTRLTVDTLVEILVKCNLVEEITDTAAATRILSKISYGRAYLSANRYASAALRNMELDDKEEIIEFGPIPKSRGRQGDWTERDTQRSMNIIAEQLKQRGTPLPNKEE